MEKPNESITRVFERFNKLINDLQLHNKNYETKEVNLKFLLTMPDHLESKISVIREGRDLNNITLQTLYGIFKTYELEFYQRKTMQKNKGRLENVSSALIANKPKVKMLMRKKLNLKVLLIKKIIRKKSSTLLKN